MPGERSPRQDVADHSETDSNAQHAEHPSLARIGAFSDGVFAFAITLLILAIRIPHPEDADAGQGLFSLLTEQWRSYLAFVLSFMLVGINWANHRVMFKTFARADHTLVWLNLLYLMVGVAFIPVPTAVLGAWLGSNTFNDQAVAAVFYGAAGTVGASAYILLWWYGAYAAKLTLSGAHPSPATRAHDRLGARCVRHCSADAGGTRKPTPGGCRLRGDGLHLRTTRARPRGTCQATLGSSRRETHAPQRPPLTVWRTPPRRRTTRP